jgi:hypothetical protein
MWVETRRLLFPSLFVIVIEALSMMISAVVSRGFLFVVSVRTENGDGSVISLSVCE